MITSYHVVYIELENGFVETDTHNCFPLDVNDIKSYVSI